MEMKMINLQALRSKLPEIWGTSGDLRRRSIWRERERLERERESVLRERETGREFWMVKGVVLEEVKTKG